MNFLIGDINNILNFIGNRRFKFFYQSGFNTIIIMKLNYSNQVCVPNGFSGTRLINWKTRPLPWTSPRIIWESPRYPACPIFAIFYTGILKIPSEILTSYSFASKIYIHFSWLRVPDFVWLGLCPDWEDWNDDSLRNAAEAMDLAEKYLSVPKVCFFPI